MRLGRRLHSHLPQHGVHNQVLEELFKVLIAAHLPGDSEVKHGGGGGRCTRSCTAETAFSKYMLNE